MLEHQLHVGAALVLDLGFALFDHRQRFGVVAAVQQAFDVGGDLRGGRLQPGVHAGLHRLEHVRQAVPAALGRNRVQGGAIGIRVLARSAGHGLGMGAGQRRACQGQGEQGDAKTRLDSHVGIR